MSTTEQCPPPPPPLQRYFRKGDVYVHADLHGASSTVIKNPAGADAPVPPLSLHQAGCACVCRRWVGSGVCRRELTNHTCDMTAIGGGRF